MSILHLSMTALTIVLTVGAALFYGAFVLYGAWIDGKRQAVRDQGLHPVTDPDGVVHSRESGAGQEESRNGSQRR